MRNSWGAISMKRRVNIYFNNLNKEEYSKIMSENLKDWREIREKNCLFQCSNDLKYESKVELKFYSKNKLDRL